MYVLKKTVLNRDRKLNYYVLIVRPTRSKTTHKMLVKLIPNEELDDILHFNSVFFLNKSIR